VGELQAALTSLLADTKSELLASGNGVQAVLKEHLCAQDAAHTEGLVQALAALNTHSTTVTELLSETKSEFLVSNSGVQSVLKGHLAAQDVAHTEGLMQALTALNAHSTKVAELHESQAKVLEAQYEGASETRDLLKGRQEKLMKALGAMKQTIQSKSKAQSDLMSFNHTAVLKSFKKQLGMLNQIAEDEKSIEASHRLLVNATKSIEAELHTISEEVSATAEDEAQVKMMVKTLQDGNVKKGRVGLKAVRALVRLQNQGSGKTAAAEELSEVQTSDAAAIAEDGFEGVDVSGGETADDSDELFNF
jgi:hypothetical protein